MSTHTYKINMLLLFITSVATAQISLPTFHGIQKPVILSTSFISLQTFTYKGSEESFTVPSAVANITMTAYGGGASYTADSGSTQENIGYNTAVGQIIIYW